MAGMSRFLYGPGRTGFIAPVYVGGMETPPDQGTQPRTEGVQPIDRVVSRTERALGPYVGTPPNQVMIGVQPYDNRRMQYVRTRVANASEDLPEGAYTEADLDDVIEAWPDEEMERLGRDVDRIGPNKENFEWVSDEKKQQVDEAIRAYLASRKTEAQRAVLSNTLRQIMQGTYNPQNLGGIDLEVCRRGGPC